MIENRVSELLGQACSQCLRVSEQEIVIRSSVLGLFAIFSSASPVLTSVVVPGSSTPLPLSAVLSSLSHTALPAHLSSLRRNLTTYHFDNTLRHRCSIVSTSENDPSGSVVHKLQRLTSNGFTSRDTPLGNLSELLDFLSQNIFPHLPHAQRTGFPRSLVKPLTTSIMANLLTPSLPSTLEALPDFLELTRQTVEFESRYLAGLLGGDSTDNEIRTWADNVCVHYEKARRIQILDAFRDVVLERATLKGQTFMAELASHSEASIAHDQIPPPQQDTIMEVSPTSETDAWNLDDDQSLPTTSPKSAVDDSGWGFDDEIEQSDQVEGETPEAEAEEDPGDAWGWNDDESPVGPKTGSGNKPATELHAPSKSSRGSDHVTKDTYPVSTLMTDIVQTVEKCLQEGQSLASSGIFSTLSTPTSSPGTLIMHSSALVVDLYCALYPVAATSGLREPAQHMQYSNDCYYLSEELSRVLLRVEGFADVKSKLQERRDDLSTLTESRFYEGIVSLSAPL